jgi:lia operon protein LiaG
MHRHALTLAAVLVLPVVGQAQTDRITLPGTRVAIYNLAGSLQVEGGSGNETIVEVNRGGDDRAGLRVERATIRGDEAVRVVYPTTTIVYARDRNRQLSTTVTVDDDGTYRRGSRLLGKRVTIRSTGAGTRAFADVRVIVAKGAQLTVGLAAGDVTVGNVGGLITMDVAVGSINVTGAKAGLAANLGSGAITVADAQGAVSVTTGSGSIALRDVWADRIDAETGSGEIKASNVKTPALRAVTGSGSISMGSTEAKSLSLQTGSGSIEADLASDVDNASINTGSGSVVLRVAPSIGAALNIATGSGGIRSDLPVTNESRARSRLQGSIGDGRGQLRIETGSGSVQLLKR